MKKEFLKYALIVDVLAIMFFSYLAVAENNTPATGLSALSSVGRFVLYLGTLGVLVIIFVALVIYMIMSRRK